MSARYLIFNNLRMGGAWDFLAGTYSLKEAMQLSEDFVLGGMNEGIHIARLCSDGDLEIVFELQRARVILPNLADPSALTRLMDEFEGEYVGWAWYSPDSQTLSFPENELLFDY